MGSVTSIDDTQSVSVSSDIADGPPARRRFSQFPGKAPTAPTTPAELNKQHAEKKQELEKQHAAKRQELDARHAAEKQELWVKEPPQKSENSWTKLPKGPLLEALEARQEKEYQDELDRHKVVMESLPALHRQEHERAAKAAKAAKLALIPTPAKIAAIRADNLAVDKCNAKEQKRRKAEARLRAKNAELETASLKRQEAATKIFEEEIEARKITALLLEEAKNLRDDDSFRYNTFYTQSPSSFYELVEDQLKATPSPEGLRAEDLNCILPDFAAFAHGTFAGLRASKAKGMEGSEDGDDDWSFVDHYQDSEMKGFEEVPSYWCGIFEGSGGTVQATEKITNKEGEQIKRSSPVVIIRLGPVMLQRFQTFLTTIGLREIAEDWPDKTRGNREFRFRGARAKSIVTALYIKDLPYRYKEETRAVLKWMPTKERDARILGQWKEPQETLPMRRQVDNSLKQLISVFPPEKCSGSPGALLEGITTDTNLLT